MPLAGHLIAPSPSQHAGCTLLATLHATDWAGDRIGLPTLQLGFCCFNRGLNSKNSPGPQFVHRELQPGQRSGIPFAAWLLKLSVRD